MSDFPCDECKNKKSCCSQKCIDDLRYKSLHSYTQELRKRFYEKFGNPPETDA